MEKQELFGLSMLGCQCCVNFCCIIFFISSVLFPLPMGITYFVFTERGDVQAPVIYEFFCLSSLFPLLGRNTCIIMYVNLSFRFSVEKWCLDMKFHV